MGSVGIGFPCYSDDVFPLVSPTLSGGSYEADLPLDNLQSRKLHKPARSADAELSSTRLHVDLGTSRSVGCVAVPKHTLSKSGAYWRVLTRSTSLVFDYEAGDDIAASPWPGTDSRASTKTYIDRNGIVHTASVDELAEAHFISATRHTLLELARTNLCLRSQELGTTWGATRCSVSSNTDIAPDGTTTADRLVEDSSAATTHFLAQGSLTITANANVAYSHWIKAGTRTWVALGIRETDANTDVVIKTFNLSTGAVSASTQAGGTGALVRAYVEEGEGVYEGWSRCVLVANIGGGHTTVRAELYLAEGDNDITYSGDGASYVIAWGAQVEDSASFATSYIPTTSASVTRAVDVLSFDIPSGLTTPAESTYYVKFVERGSILTTNAKVFQVSESGSNASALILISNGTRYVAQVIDSDGSTVDSTSTAGATPTFGDTVEIRITLSSAGVVQIHQSINSAAETSGTAGAAGGLPAQWGTGTAKIWVNGRNGSNAGAIALQSFRIMAGTQTLTTMQASVHDSGWLDAWPSDLSAEQADGWNVPLVYLPSTAQTCRYLSLQFDDADTSAGFIDLARLVVANLWTPPQNMNLGARLGFENATTAADTDGGATIYQRKPTRRLCNFYLDHMSESEAFGTPWEIQMLNGTDRQFFLVFDIEDTGAMLAKRSFLGVLRELTAIDFDIPLLHGSGFRVREELG